jgi:hypothetical protein
MCNAEMQASMSLCRCLTREARSGVTAFVLGLATL